MRAQFCLFVVYCLAQTWAANLPSYIKPCSESDPSLNDCLKETVQATVPNFVVGIPELGIATLDPMQLGRIDVNNTALNLVFTDTIVTGLKGARINSFTMEPKKGKAKIDFTANVTLKAHYNMDGQVLILPIRGDGAAKIKITNLRIVVAYDFETRNGFWHVASYKERYEMEHAHFKFGNLFGGNAVLADTTNRFANDNWEIIINEIAPPAIKGIISACVEVVKAFYSRVPASDLLTA